MALTMGSSSMSKLPHYQRIKHELKQAIESGRLIEGDRVPSELELADQYHVSRNPTRQALRELELEGFITRTRRRGSFVAPAENRVHRLAFHGDRVVALVIPHVRSPHVRKIIDGFVYASGMNGYNAIMYFMDCTDQDQAELLDDIRQCGVAGVALWLAEDCKQTRERLQSLHTDGFPVVLLDRYLRTLEYDSVVTDNTALTRALTKALVDAGHEHIGFFRSSATSTANEDRYEGYLSALRDAGIKENPELAAVIPPGSGSSAYEIHRMVAQKGRPTAFVCGEGWLALLVVQELQQLGYQIPSDIAISSVEDGELKDSPELAFATGGQQSYEMGKAAAELLVQRIKTPESPVEHHFLPPILNLHQGRAKVRHAV
jgi:DNA-binding LacI/PurR family transcriptional regulator